MGNMVKPFCKCNHEFKELFIGTGMIDFVGKKKDYVPSPCFHCKTVVETNLYNKRYRCPKCKRKVEPYVSIKKNESDEFFKSFGIDFEFEYELEDKKYKCPNCKEVELRFEWWGLWD